MTECIWSWPSYPADYPWYSNPTFIPQGCVCPPTSEQTCENPMCPRKDPNRSKAP